MRIYYYRTFPGQKRWVWSEVVLKTEEDREEFSRKMREEYSCTKEYSGIDTTFQVWDSDMNYDFYMVHIPKTFPKTE